MICIEWGGVNLLDWLHLLSFMHWNRINAFGARSLIKRRATFPTWLNIYIQITQTLEDDQGRTPCTNCTYYAGGSLVWTHPMTTLPEPVSHVMETSWQCQNLRDSIHNVRPSLSPMTLAPRVGLYNTCALSGGWSFLRIPVAPHQRLHSPFFSR